MWVNHVAYVDDTFRSKSKLWSDPNQYNVLFSSLPAETMRRIELGWREMYLIYAFETFEQLIGCHQHKIYFILIGEI